MSQALVPAVDEMFSHQRSGLDPTQSADLPGSLPPNSAELYAENPAAFAQALYSLAFRVCLCIAIPDM